MPQMRVNINGVLPCVHPLLWQPTQFKKRNSQLPPGQEAGGLAFVFLQLGYWGAGMWREILRQTKGSQQYYLRKVCAFSLLVCLEITLWGRKRQAE